MKKQKLSVVEKISISVHIPVHQKKALQSNISIAHYIDQPYKVCINRTV